MAAAGGGLAIALAGALGARGRMPPRSPEPHALAVAAATTAPTSSDPAEADPRAAIGRQAFFDATLSTPPGTSCASCHDPSQGYAGNNGSTRGTARGSRPDHFARRATPSVLYLRFVRRFHFRWEEEADLPDALGGFFWDGRADSIAALVRQPLLNPDEMGNTDLGDIARRLRAAPYAGDLEREFDHVFDTPESAIEALGQSLEAFLTSPTMSPFSSRYDDFVRGRADLTALEKRGLALFEDHEKGACSSCHTLDPRSAEPARSLFTDSGYETLAVPRNRALPGNRDARTFDLGICERPAGKWHLDDDRFCGSFRTPSLRNVAVRPSFMHNGVFSKLREVVAFYATRATSPERWYPSGEYDDLPKKYWPQVNTNPAPYHRRRGETPSLDDGDVDAIVAFLQTLTDRDVPR